MARNEIQEVCKEVAVRTIAKAGCAVTLLLLLLSSALAGSGNSTPQAAAGYNISVFAPDSWIEDPIALVFDNWGNLYIGDTYTNTIEMITPSGEQSTYLNYIGSGGGADGACALGYGAFGGLFVSRCSFSDIDPENQQIFRVAHDVLQVVYPHADLPAGFLRPPYGIAFFGGDMFVSTDHKIMRITLEGEISTFISDLSKPSGIAFDRWGNLYVTEKVRYGAVVKFSVDGKRIGNVAELSYPAGIAVDDEGNIFVGETGKGRVLKIDPNNELSVIADGFFIGLREGFEGPVALALNVAGELYVADNTDYVGTTEIYRILPVQE